MDHICIHEREFGELSTAVEDLKRWQKTQNGTLTRIEKKIDAFNAWLYGVLGSLVLALILLIFNLVIKR